MPAAPPEASTTADPRRARRRRVAATLVIVGLLCALAGLYANHRARAASASQVRGRVTGKSARKDGSLWYLDVAYRYQVDDASYQRRETRLIRAPVDNEAEAAAQFAEIAVGKELPVYYDPGAPGQGVLERARGDSWFLVGVGGLWMALGLLWLAYDRNVSRED